MSSVTNPNSKFILAAKNTNRSIRDTPVTISGLMIGIFVMFITIAFGTFFMLFMPMAARVPRTVETMLAITAIISVFTRDEIMISFWKSFLYQSRVKPLNTLLLFDSLNEKTISTNMGT